MKKVSVFCDSRQKTQSPLKFAFEKKEIESTSVLLKSHGDHDLNCKSVYINIQLFKFYKSPT